MCFNSEEFLKFLKFLSQVLSFFFNTVSPEPLEVLSGT